MRNQLKNRTNAFVTAALAGAVLMSAAGCTSKVTAAGDAPPPDVQVAVVQQKDIPVEREWIGTLDGSGA